MMTKEQLESIGVSIPELAGLDELEAELARLRGEASTPPTSLRTLFDSGALTPTNARKHLDAAVDAMIRQEAAMQALADLDSAANPGQPTPFERARRRVLRKHIDQIIEALRPRFDENITTLQGAVEKLGTWAPKQDAASQSEGAAQAYFRFREATRGNDEIVGALSGITGNNVAASWFLAGLGHTKDRVDEVRRAATSVRGFLLDISPGRAASICFAVGGLPALIYCKYPIRLNTPKEARAIEAEIEELVGS